MEFGISTLGWAGEPLGGAVLDPIRRAGFRWIELFAVRHHLDYHDRGAVRNLTEWFLGNDVEPPGLHLPFYERTGKSTRRWISALASAERDRLAALDEFKRALEITDRLGVAYVVAHLGTPADGFSPVAFEHAYTLVRTIREFADVRILLENIDNHVATPERLEEFIRATDSEDVSICYDIGHRVPGTGWPRLDRVRLLHLNDNGSQADDHALPFDGTVNWPSFVRHIAESRFAGAAVIEAGGQDLDAAVRAVDRFRDMLGEAQGSIEEFSARYTLETGSETE